MADSRPTVWRIAHETLRALEHEGEHAAADIVRKVGALGDASRDLSYRLFGICERKKWSKEALAYNALVVAWPEISRVAQSQPDSQQASLL
jgi:putative DNA methylase